MNGNLTPVLARSLKEQFSKSSQAWKEQSDPIFRFWTDGDWWGFPFFSLSASRYFGDKETLCLYWPLGPLSLQVQGARFLHRILRTLGTCLKADVHAIPNGTYFLDQSVHDPRMNNA